MGNAIRMTLIALRLSGAHLCLALAAAALICAGWVSASFAQVTETVLYSFGGGSDGSGPFSGGLILDNQGALYGTTAFAGAFGDGVVFKLTPRAGDQAPWDESVLWSFTGGSDGDLPFATVLDRNTSPSPQKTLYGTTTGFAGGNGTIFKLKGQTLTTLWNFTGGSDGSLPIAGLVADKTGTLYGAAAGGGTHGNGTVFALDTTGGTFTTLWSFTGGIDGGGPQGTLLLSDKTGALYGTTFGGGAFSSGVVFKLTPPAHGQTAWNLTTLWSFTGGIDGANPFTIALIADDSGALYGTTFGGGAFNNGVVFKLTPPAPGQTAWTETTLYSFTGGSDGANPTAGVIADKNGAIYGTTYQAGLFTASPDCGFFGCGTVFKLTPPASGQTAWTETTLWSFTGLDGDGATPGQQLVADRTGALYSGTQFRRDI